MTRQLTVIILMGLFSFLFGCKNNDNSSQTNNSDNTKLEDITSRIDPEEGFIDIFLKIIENTKTDTSHIYIAKGLYKDKTVGLQIEVRSNIAAVSLKVNQTENLVLFQMPLDLNHSDERVTTW